MIIPTLWAWLFRVNQVQFVDLYAMDIDDLRPGAGHDGATGEDQRYAAEQVAKNEQFCRDRTVEYNQQVQADVRMLAKARAAFIALKIQRVTEARELKARQDAERAATRWRSGARKRRKRFRKEERIRKMKIAERARKIQQQVAERAPKHRVRAGEWDWDAFVKKQQAQR